MSRGVKKIQAFWLGFYQIFSILPTLALFDILIPSLYCTRSILQPLPITTLRPVAHRQVTYLMVISSPSIDACTMIFLLKIEIGFLFINMFVPPMLPT
ncbi:MAG: hypothetical protein J6A96_05265 [Clostridia bacterium]|nr:hypothetical protein [Clostridia bacterium]